MKNISKKTILFITHKQTQCGVYEFGKDIAEILKQSIKYNFVKVECGTMGELRNAIAEYHPSAIVYNYHPGTMLWLTYSSLKILHKSKISDIQIPQIGIIHEVTQDVIDRTAKNRQSWIMGLSRRLPNNLFDHYIAPDPTLSIKRENVFQTGRLIPVYKNIYPIPHIPTIGSFGFATGNKGFEAIVEQVQEEFDEAIIRFNIPFAHFGDKSGENAHRIAMNCKKILYKKDIKLEITHHFFQKKEMLDFLGKNTINVFLYQNPLGESRGISSVIENALAVQRPICISESSMFRHISGAEPSISIEDNSLRNIIKNGFRPLEPYYDMWKQEGIIDDYERMIDAIV